MMRDAIYYILYIYIYIDVKLPLYTCVFGFLKIHFFACHDFVFLTLYLFVFCPGEFPIIQTVFSPSDFFYFLFFLKKSPLPTLYSFYFRVLSLALHCSWNLESELDTKTERVSCNPALWASMHHLCDGSAHHAQTLKKKGYNCSENYADVRGSKKILVGTSYQYNVVRLESVKAKLLGSPS